MTTRSTTSPGAKAGKDSGSLLGQYADLMNKHGADSRVAEAFRDTHSESEDFVGLARVAKFLKEKIDRYQAQRREETRK